MTKIGKIICYGQNYATKHWSCDHFIGIHRLYHIHSGKGSCIHNGKDYAFSPGHLYYIPFSEDFSPYSDPDDPILHTYVDFERIPPIVTNKILSVDSEGDETVKTAAALFDEGAKRQDSGDEDFRQLCNAAILYITAVLAKENNVAEISDPVVVSALEIIHRKMHEDLRASDLASRFYMSTDGFIRRFRKALGITPYAYLKNLRLNTARYLRGQGISYETIAEKTGYADASSLLHAMNRK